jgi:hypothetical protein
MKKIIFAVLVLSLISCGEMQQKSYELSNKTRNEGIYRDYKLVNSRTDKVIEEFHGVSYIDDNSDEHNLTIYIKGTNETWQKIDVIGDGFILISKSGVIE